MINARIVELFSIGDDHTEHRTEIKKLMPVSIVASQAEASRLSPDRVAKTDLRNELLEPLPVGVTSARLAKIFVNDLHALSRPTEINGAIHKAILEFGALLVVLDLRHRRLADIDIDQLRTTRRVSRSSGLVVIANIIAPWSPVPCA